MTKDEAVFAAQQLAKRNLKSYAVYYVGRREWNVTGNLAAAPKLHTHESQGPILVNSDGQQARFQEVTERCG